MALALSDPEKISTITAINKIVVATVNTRTINNVLASVELRGLITSSYLIEAVNDWDSTRGN